MKDKNINGLYYIANGLKSPIYTLHCQNTDYGTWFDLWRTGERTIVLDLKNKGIIESHAIKFNVNIDNVTEMSEAGWINHAVMLFENKIFTLQ